jgi:hypothetical protein
MKLLRLLAVGAVLATPFASFAQSNSPVTRESVRQELAALEKAGYNPAGDQSQYPNNILAAEASVSAQDRAAAESYGPATAGTSEMGAPKTTTTSTIGLDSPYTHH